MSVSEHESERPRGGYPAEQRANHGGDSAGIPPSSEGAIEDEPDLDEEAAAALVESDLSQLEGERTELVDTLRRVQADFENYRKRVMREQTTLVERATERLVADLLPVLDSFDGALGSLGPVDTPEQEQVRNGVLGIHSQLVAVLQKAGLARIESDGEAFDPNQHEAVMQDDGDGEPRVAQTLRTGYRLKDRVLRPAMVRVTRA